MLAKPASKPASRPAMAVLGGRGTLSPPMQAWMSLLWRDWHTGTCGGGERPARSQSKDRIRGLSTPMLLEDEERLWRLTAREALGLQYAARHVHNGLVASFDLARSAEAGHVPAIHAPSCAAWRGQCGRNGYASSRHPHSHVPPCRQTSNGDVEHV